MADTDDELAPEQELTIVALRLAILEKAATGVGVLAFVWATVVLLGGFVTLIQTFDFWLVSALLLTEGTRVFSRSHELEWQHAANGKVRPKPKLTGSASSVVLEAIHLGQPSESIVVEYPPPHTFNVKRTWSWNTVPFLPYSSRFSARDISLLLYILQLLSATVTVVFSSDRLLRQDYVQGSPGNNLGSGLNIFYSLSLLEASIFLVERAYLEYNMRWKNLLEKVADKSMLGTELLDIVRQFFYDVYSRCLKGSVFDGLDLDLVSYSIHKIKSNSGKEQLGGGLMLSKFVQQKSFLEDTLRKVGTTHGVTERLVEMCTWRSKHEKEIRSAAAKILCQLVIHNTNSFRVMAIAGALESITTLLTEQDENDELKLDGLRILKSLANDDKNCVQIGNTRGLLSILVTNMRLQTGKNQLKVLKKTLQLLARLVSTTADLKHRIVKIVFTLSNLRDILEQSGSYLVFRELSIDIITGLALDESIKENIGRTGGIMQNLLTIFHTGAELPIRLKTGAAINLLVLKSPENTSRIDLQKFISVVKDLNTEISTSAADILRSTWEYLSENEKQQLTVLTGWLLEKLDSVEGKQLQAFLGLAACTLAVEELRPDKEAKHGLILHIMRLISETVPCLELPQIRRYCVELIIVLMRRDNYCFSEFKGQGILNKLERMVYTVSDVENFFTFSGMTGITAHSQTMQDLLSVAIQMAASNKYHEENA